MKDGSILAFKLFLFSYSLVSILEHAYSCSVKTSIGLWSIVAIIVVVMPVYIILLPHADGSIPDA